MINVDEIETKATNSFHQANCQLNGQPVERVTSFQYRGSNIASDGGALGQLNSRISKARAALLIPKKVWHSSQIERRTKIPIFNPNQNGY